MGLCGQVKAMTRTVTMMSVAMGEVLTQAVKMIVIVTMDPIPTKCHAALW